MIFQLAKRRCYIMTTSKQAVPVADIAEDEDGWQALDEVERGGTSHEDKGKEKDDRPPRLPVGMEPVLEELPKWNLLAEVLREKRNRKS
jgi:DNA excision repair protein ERCC-4